MATAFRITLFFGNKIKRGPIGFWFVLVWILRLWFLFNGVKVLFGLRFFAVKWRGHSFFFFL
ncbi:hypothetical protein ACQWF9_26055, partial [Salmonella enterica subsp. enterica serovar Infantis]